MFCVFAPVSESQLRSVSHSLHSHTCFQSCWDVVVDAHFEVKMRQEIENVQDGLPAEPRKNAASREREKGT